MNREAHKKVASAFFEKITAAPDPKPVITILAHLLHQLPRKDRTAIYSLFQELLYMKEGVVKASVATPVALQPSDREQIMRHIKDAMHAREVDLTETVDAALLGGLKIRIGDMLYDSSLKRKLHLLKNKLTNA